MALRRRSPASAVFLALSWLGASAFLSKPGLAPRGMARLAPRTGHRPVLGMFFERLSDDAVAAVMSAQQEAAKMGCAEVGTEHLLLGLIAYPETADKAMRDAGLAKADAVRGAVAALPGNGGGSDAAKESGGVFGDLFGANKGKGGKGDTLPFTGTAKKVFDTSMKEADALKRETIGSEILLVGALTTAPDTSAATVLQTLGVDVDVLIEGVKEAAKSAPELVAAGKGNVLKSESPDLLEEFCINLNELAEAGDIDPVIGRSEELRRLTTVLVRRRKNNACLVGDPGVGKTAIAEGLALAIVEGNVPPRLQNATVLSLDLSAMVAGTRYRGAFEERLQQLLDEMKAQRAKGSSVILFIDELHNLLGAGSAGEGTMDAANMLKPALARGELQCVGATTMEEYRRYVSKDAALERRFQPLMVPEPSEAECVDILHGLKDRYEEHHGVVFTDDALLAAVSLSARYIADRFLPDKAIDLVDEAGAEVQLRASRTAAGVNGEIGGGASTAKLHDGSEDLEDVAGNRVRAADVAGVVARWTGVPVQKLTLDESQSLLTLESTLASRVLGQPDAVHAVSRAVRRARAGLRPAGRPVASFLFCGPTGVGKTELAKALASAYYGSEKAMVRLDMSEYMERHTVSRLTGPPPGYIGFEAGGQLTEAVRRQPHSLVLLDEVEKAHPDVFNALLQVLDDGRLTDSAGRTVDFSNVLLIMTANVGSRAILKGLEESGALEGVAAEDGGAAASEDLDPASRLMAAYDALQDATKDVLSTTKFGDSVDADVSQILGSLGEQGDMLRAALGGAPPPAADLAPAPTTSAAATSSSNYASIVATVKSELGDFFRPEFLNRLDELVVFQPLPSQDLSAVARLLVGAVAEMAKRELEVDLTVSDAFVERVVVDGAADARFGARPMRRAVARLLEDPLAEALMQGFLKPGDGAMVDSVVAAQDGRSVSVMNMRNRAKRNFAVAEGSGGIESAGPPPERVEDAELENAEDSLETPLPMSK